LAIFLIHSIYILQTMSLTACFGMTIWAAEVPPFSPPFLFASCASPFAKEAADRMRGQKA